MKETRTTIRKSKIGGSTSNRAMDIGKSIFRDRVHLELSDPGQWLNLEVTELPGARLDIFYWIAE
ncbi:hypothetical protein OROMI_026120 [Orobanche minor]